MPKNINWEDDSHEEGLEPAEAPTNPTYESGQRVRLLETEHDRFKRRPDYAEDAVGEITCIHGAYEMPTADGTSETTYEYLYGVRFTHADIWGDDHPESNGSISLDLWEQTLAPVSR